VVDIEEAFGQPELLRGMTPDQIVELVKDNPHWRVEQLRQGSHAGQGWVFREYTPQATSPAE
jgi:hypothetical protein